MKLILRKLIYLHGYRKAKIMYYYRLIYISTEVNNKNQFKIEIDAETDGHAPPNSFAYIYKKSA